jgi:hypothetical protein
LLQPPIAAPFPIICAGSATQAGIAVYNEYTFADGKLKVTRRKYSREQHAYLDHESFEVELGRGAVV